MTTIKIGSPKQIEWAESIKDQWLAQIKNVVDTAERRVTDNSMPARWEEIVRRYADAATEKLDTMAHSKQFIDNRRINIGDLVSKDAVKEYNEG